MSRLLDVGFGAQLKALVAPVASGLCMAVVILVVDRTWGQPADRGTLAGLGVLAGEAIAALAIMQHCWVWSIGDSGTTRARPSAGCDGREAIVRAYGQGQTMSRHPPRVSVVIPTYNGERTVHTAVAPYTHRRWQTGN